VRIRENALPPIIGIVFLDLGMANASSRTSGKEKPGRRNRTGLPGTNISTVHQKVILNIFGCIKAPVVTGFVNCSWLEIQISRHAFLSHPQRRGEGYFSGVVSGQARDIVFIGSRQKLLRLHHFDVIRHPGAESVPRLV
jgi:hypothetical protein